MGIKDTTTPLNNHLIKNFKVKIIMHPDVLQSTTQLEHYTLGINMHTMLLNDSLLLHDLLKVFFFLSQLLHTWEISTPPLSLMTS